MDGMEGSVLRKLQVRECLHYSSSIRRAQVLCDLLTLEGTYFLHVESTKSAESVGKQS